MVFQIRTRNRTQLKYPVLPNWGFIHDFTELLASEVAGAGEAGGGVGGGLIALLRCTAG